MGQAALFLSEMCSDVNFKDWVSKFSNNMQMYGCNSRCYIMSLVLQDFLYIMETVQKCIKDRFFDTECKPQNSELSM